MTGHSKEAELEYIKDKTYPNVGQKCVLGYVLGLRQVIKGFVKRAPEHNLIFYFV